MIPFDPKPVTPAGTADVVSDRFMCISCHDGFVMDSRSLWKKDTHTHPVGQKPSDSIVLPQVNGKEVLPLTEEGNIYCGTCHSAHGMNWNEPGSALFLRADNKNSELCMTCHQQRTTGADAGNHPVNRVVDHVPESLLALGSRFSDKGEVICQSCHGIHATASESLLITDNSNSELCASCHESQKDLINNKHNLAITAPDSVNVNDDKPSVKGPCSACHLPHNADGPRLWARKLDGKADFPSASCNGCHDDTEITAKKVTDHSGHPVNVSLEQVNIQATAAVWTSRSEAESNSLAEMQPLPLYDSLGNPAESGGIMSCSTCHDPHQWQQPLAVTTSIRLRSHAEIKSTEGDSSNSFLRIANQESSALCTNCHRREALVVNTKHDLNVIAPKSRNRLDTTPSQSGVCSACHVPHNGEGNSMWARALPDSLASGEQCVSCHQKDAVASNYLTGAFSHPIGVPLGDLVQKRELPLRDADGADKPPSIDCNTCHNPHEWSPDIQTFTKQDLTDLEGNGSNSFLRQTVTGSGDLCVNCHAGEAVVIGTDHDLPLTAPDALSPGPQSTLLSGACGQCHATHNAGQSYRLWPIKLNPDRDDGHNVADQMCTHCHNSEGIASIKVPDELLHAPRNVTVNLGRLRKGQHTATLNPVYDTDGKRNKLGQITCLTCHNPHRWSSTEAVRTQAVNGANREGDAISSFLHTASTINFLCADCHGPDALYRYKFYHWKESREQPRPRILR